MKINWKHLATTKGYKSLKATYIKAVQNAVKQKRPMRDKKEYLKQFNWIINRAKHHAYTHNIPIETILDIWESKRDYGWLNYYQDNRQPKFTSKCLKPTGIKGTRKYYKNDKWTKNDPVIIKKRMKSFISWFCKNKTKKDKPRWSMERKKRGY